MYGYGFRNISRSILGGGGGVNPLWSGLLAYYTADNTPNDALGNYNGTLVNGATYGTGIINNGFSFDGVNDYVDLPLNMFKETGDFSISFWVKKIGGSDSRLVQFSNDAPYNGVLIYTFSGNNIRVGIGNAGTLTTFSAGNITLNDWKMVTFTRDSINSVNKIYVDSALAGTFSSAVNPTYPASCIGRIGSSSTGTVNLNGLVDELGLWNRALSVTEITELYNSGSGLQY